ncbi:MAG: cobalamin-dependent protein [Clostridiales Family XIII bacterium]|jgi:methanogenic corrinoid protein MtbC1|nr:cobalamin-dependent protein [Clostridiales Family XIII bacterium]
MIDCDVFRKAIGNLEEEHVADLIDAFLASQPCEEDARDVLNACQQGMEIVGERFGQGAYFVGDLVFAGAMLTSALEKLKPLLGFGNGDFSEGTVVLGTVEGDVHHIGKNLFKTMLEAANFRVIDIGIDQPPKAFAEAAIRYKPDIVGLSGLLTTAVDSMRETALALKEAGLRRKVKIFIGGNIVGDSVCDYVGADAWSRNAYEAVLQCKAWIGEKK